MYSIRYTYVRLNGLSFSFFGLKIKVVAFNSASAFPSHLHRLRSLANIAEPPESARLLTNSTLVSYKKTNKLVNNAPYRHSANKEIQLNFFIIHTHSLGGISLSVKSEWY